MKTNFRKFLLIIIILLILLFLWAKYLNTKGLTIKEYAVSSSSIPKETTGLKIVHFSDILYGSTTNIDDIKNIVKNINELKPDIVVFTGDLLNKNHSINKKTKEKITNELKNINPTLTKYAVIGDNDKKDIDTFTNIMNESEFIILDNSSELIYYKDSTPIKLVGLTNTKDLDSTYNIDENKLYTITLVHKPDTITELNDYPTNLVLAGHSLGGLLKVPLAGGLITKNGAKKYYEPYYDINDTKLYISNGIGTEDIPFRTFNKPSITLYRLYSK